MATSYYNHVGKTTTQTEGTCNMPSSDCHHNTVGIFQEGSKILAAILATDAYVNRD